jgi:hypothetical protein
MMNNIIKIMNKNNIDIIYTNDDKNITNTLLSEKYNYDEDIIKKSIELTYIIAHERIERFVTMMAFRDEVYPDPRPWARAQWATIRKNHEMDCLKYGKCEMCGEEDLLVEYLLIMELYLIRKRIMKKVTTMRRATETPTTIRKAVSILPLAIGWSQKHPSASPVPDIDEGRLHRVHRRGVEPDANLSEHLLGGRRGRRS